MVPGWRELQESLYQDCPITLQNKGTQYLIIPSGVLGVYGFRMAGIARVVVPGLPHHITQRGNEIGGQFTYFVERLDTEWDKFEQEGI